MKKKKTEENIWTMDITHYLVGSLAVFGLVVSSAVATLGVTTLGVRAQVAFAQDQSNQTAIVAEAAMPSAPVSYTNNASNAASMVEAVSEIGDGYTKLFQTTLASFGL